VTCDLPARRWADGFRRPLTLVLCAGGLVSTTVATVTDSVHRSGPVGVLAVLGPVLFLLGSGNGVLGAHELGSLFGFVNAARTRREELTRECEEQRVRMRCIAEQLCADESAVVRTLDLTTVDVCREWPRGVGTDFTVYLLCRTIVTAEAQARVYGGRTHLDPDTDDEARVIHALHDLCGVHVPEVARMLDRDVEAVRTVLSSASPGGRA
jgi:hypothetical protein